MRGSRRRKGLNPELTPATSPSNSDESEFLQDFQVETTLEEEERLQREELERQVSSERNEESEENEESSDIEKTQSKDIVMSSDSSDDEESNTIMIEVDDEPKSKISSE